MLSIAPSYIQDYNFIWYTTSTDILKSLLEEIKILNNMGNHQMMIGKLFFTNLYVCTRIPIAKIYIDIVDIVLQIQRGLEYIVTLF